MIKNDYKVKKMIYQRLVYSVLALLFLATSSFHSIEQSLVPDLHFMFKPPNGKYVFHYPTNWVKNDEVKGFDLFILAPKDQNGRSLANISIISGELPQEVDLDIYYKKNMENLLKNPSIKVKDEGRYLIGDLSSKWVRYNKEDDHTEIIHYFLVANGMGVVITCGAAKEEFINYIEAFATIAKSFKFSKEI